jgi:ankyrin repeat protein
VIPRKHYILLLDHGVDINAVDPSGTPLIIETARNDRWDLVLLLMDRGADPLRPDPRGTRLADVVQSRVESTTVRPPEMLADIARVKARLAQ